jgi:hypothetical protein
LKNPADDFLSAGFFNPWEIKHEKLFSKFVGRFSSVGNKRLATFENCYVPSA